jgi:hypothetical protein
MAGLLHIECDSRTGIFNYVRIKTTKYVHITQFYEKVPRKCLDIPHTMELVKTVVPLELIMHTNRFLNSCRDNATVLGELCITKPLRKLEKLRDNWDELVGRSCIE